MWISFVNEKWFHVLCMRIEKRIERRTWSLNEIKRTMWTCERSRERCMNIVQIVSLNLWITIYSNYWNRNNLKFILICIKNSPPYYYFKNCRFTQKFSLIILVYIMHQFLYTHVSYKFFVSRHKRVIKAVNK